MSGRPLIAVPGVPITAGGVLGWRQGAVAVPASYLEALERAGADGAVLMPEALDEAAAAARLARFDGLMLPGGGDIDPGEYGEEAHPEVAFVNLARDRFEIPLIRVAVATSLPTLAICRGYQVLNVAFGGTLDQHINEREGLVAHRSDNGKEGVLHPVRIEPGCRLAKAVGTELDEAFSHHHQALGRLGTGLSVVAWAPDGIAEAVEFSTGGWVVGIQWHAEATAAADPAQQAIFDAFVEQVSSPRSTG